MKPALAPPSRTVPVGVVGAGRMGGAYAMHLCSAGHDVWVVDPSPEACELATGYGCSIAASVDEVWSTGAEVIVLSLATEAAFHTVVAELVAAGRRIPRPVTVVETSTLPLDTKQAGRDALEAVGVALVDCPVSGTGQQALERDLVVYASGPDEALDRAQPVLEAISDHVHRLGEFGLGTQVKLLANLLVGVHNAAAAEMLALAERAGLDPEWALAVVSDGAGQSRMLEQRGHGMARHDYGYGATVDLFRKDLGIIGRFARAAGSRTPLLDVVAELYEEAARLGLGGQESAAVHRVYLEPAVGERSDREE